MPNENHNAASGHGQDWGLDNLSSAHDHGRATEFYVPRKIMLETPDVTVFDRDHQSDYLVAKDEKCI